LLNVAVIVIIIIINVNILFHCSCPGTDVLPESGRGGRRWSRSTRCLRATVWSGWGIYSTAVSRQLGPLVVCQDRWNWNPGHPDSPRQHIGSRLCSVHHRYV